MRCCILEFIESVRDFFYCIRVIVTGRVFEDEAKVGPPSFRVSQQEHGDNTALDEIEKSEGKSNEQDIISQLIDLHLEDNACIVWECRFARL